MFIGFVCLALTLSQAENRPADDALTITIEFLEWTTTKDRANLPPLEMPANTKVAILAEIDIVPGRPFAGKVRTDGKEFSFSGVVRAPTKGKAAGTLDFSLTRPQESIGGMTAIDLPLGMKTVVSGSTRVTTQPSGVSFAGNAFRVAVAKKNP